MLNCKGGYFQFASREDGLYLTVYPSKDDGRNATQADVMYYLDNRNISNYDVVKVKEAFDKAKNSPYTVKVSNEFCFSFGEFGVYTMSPDLMIMEAVFYPPFEGASMMKEEEIVKDIMNLGVKSGIKKEVIQGFLNEREYGKFGGKNGDLYLLIKIEEKKTSEGTNKIVIETSIPPWKAALGGIVDIPLDGKYLKIEIPPLTKSGTRFKLNKEDTVGPKTGGNSEYIALIKIDISENLSKKEIELYKKLREIDLGKNL